MKNRKQKFKSKGNTKKAFINPMMSRKYTAVQREQLRKFEKDCTKTRTSFGIFRKGGIEVDRHFVLQKEYAEELTGHLFEHLFRRYCGLSLDTWKISEEAPKERKITNENGRELFVIPVGFLEFVQETLRSEAVDAVDPNMTPIEIPRCLESFLGRRYIRMISGADLLQEGYTDSSKYFIKSVGHLKEFNSTVQFGDISHLINPKTAYSVSEKINIRAEYRVLVINDSVVDAQFCVGDPLVFPNGGTIRSMINTYSNVLHPRAYTLDVAVSNCGTVPIEIHPFVSCGMYSICEDPRILNMLEYGYRWYLQEAPF